MLKSRYSLTLIEYYEMYKSQGGKCKICGDEKEINSRSGLVVDHCHKSGKVRGMLCTSCNSALGKFKESEKILNRAIDYLNVS